MCTDQFISSFIRSFLLLKTVVFIVETADINLEEGEKMVSTSNFVFFPNACFPLWSLVKKDRKFEYICC